MSASYSGGPDGPVENFERREKYVQNLVRRLPYGLVQKAEMPVRSSWQLRRPQDLVDVFERKEKFDQALGILTGSGWRLGGPHDPNDDVDGQERSA